VKFQYIILYNLLNYSQCTIYLVGCGFYEVMYHSGNVLYPMN